MLSKSKGPLSFIGKPVLGRHSKVDKTKILMMNRSGESRKHVIVNYRVNAH